MANMDQQSQTPNPTEHDGEWTDNLGALRETIGAVLSYHPEGQQPSSDPTVDTLEVDDLRIVFDHNDGSGAVTVKQAGGAATYHIDTQGKVASVDYLGETKATPDEDSQATLMQALEPYAKPPEAQE